MSSVGKHAEPPPLTNNTILGPDPEDIRKFLEYFRRPIGWLLISIAIVKAPPRVQRFEPDELEKAVAWVLEENNKQRNVYHIPGEFRTDKIYLKPPELNDMTGSRCLWVDMDPGNTEEAVPARPRMLFRLTDGRPIDVPAPTGILCSGNGYQAYWRTDLIDGDTLEAKNRWLIELLGADASCFNRNRMMRVPGTVNFPTEAKLKKGRTVEMSALVCWHEGGGLPGNKVPMLEKRDAKSPALSTPNVERTYTRRKLTDDDLAELGIPQSVRALIVSGWDMDNSRFKGRSEAVFSATMSMVKHNVSDDDVYSVLLDESFGISAHVLDQSDPEKYAQRQINRAKERVLSPELAEMNEKHAVIASYGGKLKVTRWVPSPLDPSKQVLQLQNLNDFQQSYGHLLIGPPGDQQGLGRWWLGQPRRRQFENLVFKPGEPEEIGPSLNLWRGFAIDPAPGDWSKLHDHILSNLAAGVEEHAEYITRWCAWLVQNPGTRAEVALVLQGGRGTGKGIFGNVLMKIFGQHALQVSSARHVSGNFNAHLRDTCFLFSDESYFPGARSEEGALKRLLTEPTLFIEAKGVDGESHPNCLHVLMASNEDWVVPAGMDERRFAVFQVGAGHQQDPQYFRALVAELDSGGREAFLHDLLHMDLGNWHPRDVPKTQALMEQKLATLQPEDEWYLDLLQAGHLPNPEAAANKAVAKGLFDAARESVPRLRDASSARLGRCLARWGCTRIHIRGHRGWAFPPLGHAREKFERKIGGPIAWDYPNIKDWLPHDDEPLTEFPF